MSDLSKCSGLNCPIKSQCYRYTAPTGIWQSYLTPPFTVKDGVVSCTMYWGANQQGILNQLKSIMK